jgi:Mn-dependent DtxR family transcriptional regulator
MELFKSGEDYLERILILRNKQGNVRSIDIVNDMHFSKPSVSIAMKKLKKVILYHSHMMALFC